MSESGIKEHSQVGRLPTTSQFDKAVGFVPGRGQSGPTQAGLYGLSDFPANNRSNGWEFTRNLTAEQGREAANPKVKIDEKTVPLPNAPQGTLVIVRGQRKTDANEPLTFEKLQEQQTPALLLVQIYGIATPFTGIRIVIETEPPK